MKRLLLSAIALTALFSAPLARAWSYNDGDLLLIFRESISQNDVEYDLGSVSNLLGHPEGYTTTLTGWNSNLVTSTFGAANLTNVSVILAAVTSATNATPTAWISSTDPNPDAYNVSPAVWTSTLHGTISALGNKPVTPFEVPAANVTPTNAYSISPSSAQYGGASYDYIVSGGNFQSIPTWDGKTPFSNISAQQIIPGSSDFWAVGNSYGAPDKLIGTFTITTNLTLTFVAGARPSVIAGISYSNGVSTVQFSTTVGNSYSIAYTNALGGAVSTWPVDSPTLTGDGGTDSLNHTNYTDTQEFFEIIAH
jgi:hypothetical protein